eukprot:TRINITY_DN22390_c0_g1_i1.p1 TRINITY_DN22390_c0_g1~~TRINITY_DN22390_c0_g1_i1.p1  ORF type:complete len:210 (+),score=39.62 TRINITY_DN22390_c0_g1_i1:465-1094(+)
MQVINIKAKEHKRAESIIDSCNPVAKSNNQLNNIVLEFHKDVEKPKDMKKRIRLVSNMKMPKVKNAQNYINRTNAFSRRQGFAFVQKPVRRNCGSTRQYARKQKNASWTPNISFYYPEYVCSAEAAQRGTRSQYKNAWKQKIREFRGSSGYKKDVTLAEIFDKVIIDADEEKQKPVNFFKLPIYSTLSNSFERIALNPNIERHRTSKNI